MKKPHPHRIRSPFAAALSVALFAHFAAPSASATVYYWDSDGTTPGFGNTTGTWGTDTFWSTTAAGTGATANTAITTADTVNFGTATLNYANAAVSVLAGGVSVNKINFGSGQTTALTLSGGAISLGGSAPAITVNSTGHTISSAIELGASSTVSFSRDTANAGAFSLNGQISGGFGLTFTTPNVNSGGTNQIVTLGAANTYTGNTTITTGNVNNSTIIRNGVANALPTTTVLTLNGGAGTGSGRTVSYDLNSKNQTLAGLSNTTGLSLRNQTIINTGGSTITLTISNTSPASSTFGGNITGTNLRLTKSGTGTQILSSTNPYTGITTISDGKLVGVVGGHHSSSDVTVNNVAATYGVSINDNTKSWTCKSLATTAAGTLEFNFGAVLPSDTISPLIVTNAAAFTATPAVSVLVNTGLLPGTYPLMTWGSTSGTVPATPNLTVSQIAGGTAASLAVSGSTLNLVITSTAASVVKANNSDNLNLGTSWVGAVAPDATKVAKWNSTVTTANTTDLGADATWAGIAIENPTGLVTINGTNTLTLGAAAIDLDLSTATADLTLNCHLALGDVNIWDVAATRTLILGGQVSGAFGVTKLGDGTAILSSTANSYTGTTTVSAGTLKLGASNVIPHGTGGVASNVTVNGTLDLNGKSESINGLSGSGVVDNTDAATSTFTVGNNAQTSTFSGVIQNTTGIIDLSKTGSGALTLGGANTFTGTTTVTAGALVLGNVSALSGTTGIALTGSSGVTLIPGLSGININKPITLGATGITATITAPNVAGSGTTNFPVTISDAIGGNGNVNFSGVSATNAYGVINLNAACNYAGSTLITTISGYGGGPVNNAMIFMNLGVDNALPVTTVLTLDGGDGTGTAPGRYCELDLDGNNQTLAGLTNVTGRALRIQRIVNNSATAATLTVNNSADYTYSGQLGWASGYGSAAYNNFGLTKSGIGTFTISGTNNYTGATTITGGTLTLGAVNVLPNTSPVSIGAGTLNAATTGTETAGTLEVTGAATINLGTGADLAFADSSAVAWTGTLNITATLGATSLRFGTTSGGLTSGQLALISVNGSGAGTYTLDASGYLVADGGGPGPVVSFDISAIASPQTVGTLITGITLTAKDASNAIATGFTGTVTFGGTAGCTGTSGNFVLGVLSGVSVTPTVAGSNLTFTVTDGALPTAHTGSTTITTVQTQYQAWAGGALFDADANGDGVKNGLAFLLGAANPSASALSLLPVVTQSGGNLTLTFNCRNAASRGSASLSVEHSSNLGISDPWTAVTVPDIAGPSGPTSGVTFNVTLGSPNTVTATISSSEAASGKLFGRLKANNP